MSGTPSVLRCHATWLFFRAAALGLMSKPILVTLPCLLLLLDYWPLARFRPATGTLPRTRSEGWFASWPLAWWLLVEKIPLFGLSAINCAITMSFHAEGIALNPLGKMPLAARLAGAIVAYAAYLGQSLFPINLALFYPPRLHVPLGYIVGSAALLLAITSVAVLCWRSRPYLLVGWLWFVGMLAPVSGLMPVGGLGHTRADRYTYLSQIGLSIAIAWTVWSIYRWRQSLHAASWRRWTLVAGSTGSLLVLAVVAWRQTGHWRNAETIWTHTAACTGVNRVAHSNLVDPCLEQGRTEEAIFHLREALKDEVIDDEKRAVYLVILGDVLFDHGDLDEALESYLQAVRLFPSVERGRVQLAIALAAAGRFDEAITHWREAIRLFPDRWEPRVGLAEALLAVGKTSDAVDECRQVLAQEPGAIKAIVMLGEALAAKGETAEAIVHLQRAVDLDPRRAGAQFQLGLALGDLGRFEEAVRISTRPSVSSPKTSRSCGRRPGFWQPVPTSRSAMACAPSSWPKRRSSFPGAKSRAPSTR